MAIAAPADDVADGAAAEAEPDALEAVPEAALDAVLDAEPAAELAVELALGELSDPLKLSRLVQTALNPVAFVHAPPSVLFAPDTKLTGAHWAAVSTTAPPMMVWRNDTWYSSPSMELSIT